MAKILTIGQALYQDILDHPDDDALRLIYADWLADNGQEDRAKLIHTQLQMMSSGTEGEFWTSSTEENRLLSNHINWLLPLARAFGMNTRPNRDLPGTYKGFGVDGGMTSNFGEVKWFWRAGFVHRIVCSLSSWLKAGRKVVKLTPMNYVGLRDCNPHLPSTSEHIGWILGEENPRGYACHIPKRIWKFLRLGGDTAIVNFGVAKFYNTNQEAIEDLSRASLAYAKKS